jgi:hypothetical protein
MIEGKRRFRWVAASLSECIRLRRWPASPRLSASTASTRTLNPDEDFGGDLTGVLETLFREDQERGGTNVTFNWYVRVTNPALNLLGYVAERIYRHSHDSVMREGERGLSDYCAR